jgi:glutamate--cysteine ligase
LGQIEVRDSKEVPHLRDHPLFANGHDLLIQEGVQTQERIQNLIAEPQVYMMDRYVVGGYYRLHASQPALAAPPDHATQQVVPLAFDQSAQLPQPGMPPGISAPNRFYMYGVIARLALLAASYELEATDPEAEIYD